jgi:hypothetical protein
MGRDCSTEPKNWETLTADRKMGLKESKKRLSELESFPQRDATQIAPLPNLRIAHNGPVQRYLAFSKMSREDFDAALLARNQNAVALFAADVVYQEVERLADQIQFQGNGSKPKSIDF